LVLKFVGRVPVVKNCTAAPALKLFVAAIEAELFVKVAVP
jgi:hypothetical protein